MSNATQFIKENLGIIGAGVGGAALGGVLGYAAASAVNKKRKSSKRRAKNSYSRKRSSHHKRYRKARRYPYTAGKHRDTSHRRIRFTKNGQPYIILRSGKARFIKQSSVKNSRRRAGGRY